MSDPLSVSVVIPALNESKTIGAAVGSAWGAGARQVVVADGGSVDETQKIAEQLDCVVVRSARGRGIQLNAGAAESTGEVLLFLHADCRLAEDAVARVLQASKEGALWGCFEQCIDSPGQLYRWLERGNAWRARTRGMVYGDQGIWVRGKLFDDVKGFSDQPIMEDVVLSDRLRRVSRPVVLNTLLRVSSRRWQKNGVVVQTAWNWLLFSLFRLGVSPDRIARLYGRN